MNIGTTATKFSGMTENTISQFFSILVSVSADGIRYEELG